ncbi:aminopeptidase P family protein [Carboxylicivirga sp. A043]|uniref:M24 family metallopeptidase n=1 Tax=Carboxylicivirga litoralis TaxID=2816963 RepID=UPI0021CB724B|nr:Xaa-Pro peptidase family protein [Carboxylicivirga sp. A043]MCU4158134.1 aminopeptidase P family protein [Carboxylicivirga sp. A043]
MTKNAEEIALRQQRFQKLMQEHMPQTDGAFIFSRLNIYYFTGTMNVGVLWIPKDGQSILFIRKGEERAKYESALDAIVTFSSYKNIPATFLDRGMKIPSCIAAEMNGLNWSLSARLTKSLPNTQFIPGDHLLAMTRALKSESELQIMRDAGARHHKCMNDLLPEHLHEGISELEVAHKLLELYYQEGHNGILRLESFGEELFAGLVSIGDSGNFPSAFNGPNGAYGLHPAVPYMGNKNIKWEKNTPMIIDNCFNLHGYHTDKTHTYWRGKKSDIPANIQHAFDFCVETQNYFAEQLKPGAIPSQIWAECQQRVAASPWADGFMGLGKNKVVFLGHGIGLAIDEYPAIARGFDQALQEGMTMALEPKIGIKGIGMVGIENTFEITANGGKVITGKNDEIIVV